MRCCLRLIPFYCLLMTGDILNFWLSSWISWFFQKLFLHFFCKFWLYEIVSFYFFVIALLIINSRGKYIHCSEESTAQQWVFCHGILAQVTCSCRNTAKQPLIRPGTSSSSFRLIWSYNCPGKWAPTKRTNCQWNFAQFRKSTFNSN